MKLPSHRIIIYKLKNCCNHLPGIQFRPFDKISEISVLIGADNLMLRVYTYVPVGKENKPVALKTTLDWVIFDGNKNNKTLSVRNSREYNLDEIVSKFCEIESYGV